jgi:adenylate kinase family enzyme/hemoglobin-like flavoprotein
VTPDSLPSYIIRNAKLTDQDIDLIKSSWSSIVSGTSAFKGTATEGSSNIDSIPDDATSANHPLAFFFETFYTKLFSDYPHVKPLFKNATVVQGRALVKMIATAVSLVKDMDQLTPVLVDLAQRHVKYGAVASNYGPVGEVLLFAAEKCAGTEIWSEDVKKAWLTAYSVIVTIMIPVAIKQEKEENKTKTTESTITTATKAAKEMAPAPAPKIDAKDLSLVFVLGGPGSGKGTNCERISKEFGYKHLSTGDLLRDEVKSGSELGKQLNEIMQTGALVPGEVVLKILRNAMTEGGTKPISGRYLIDGYPRAMDQVTGFESAICKPTFVLAFDAAESVLEERLVNRGKTSGRADDNVESIRKRFATFKAQSEPVIVHYSKDKIVRSLNSERPVDEVYQDVRPLFIAELARMGIPYTAPAPKIDAKDLSLVFVLGGPGSGKGTNCERISKEFGYKHLSTGDLLRDEVKSGSELGKQLNEIMQTGALVPGEVVLKILRNAMTEGGTKPISGRYLIDGYPRAMDQVTGFESAICKPTFVLAFDAAESVLEERLVNRGKTSGRADDNVESIRKRFATFKAQSEPVIVHYSKDKIVRSLNSERPVDEVYQDVRPLFIAELARMGIPYTAPAPKIDAKDLSLVFVLGGPGSGKGTNCERISKEFGYKHLSTGDLLRDEVKSGSELGKQLNEIMQTGALVPGEVVLKILRNAMTEGGTKPISGRYLIDGYPRAMDQVTGFESAICKPTFVLAFDAAESVLEERLVNRGKTSGRADDNVESIRKRFATFKAQSEPVIVHYSKDKIVRSLNSERPVDEVYQDVRPLFIAELARMGIPYTAPAPKIDAKDLSLVFVLGGPGSGKGTNCERISKEFGYKHLSTGDLLRDEVKSGSELGKQLNEIMQTGALVPGEVVLKILRNAMTEGGTKPISGRYLIDGYPRAMDQVTGFESAICKPTFVLAFDAAESVLEERLVNRGKTSGRADDNVESIRKRFATFKAQSEPVIVHYSKDKIVRSLNSERPVDEVYQDVRPLFIAELARMGIPYTAPAPKIDAKDLSLVFVLGGPGSGKGTNCERISKEFGYKHLSTGDLLRDEVKSGSELGKQLNEIMQTGALVPGEVVLKILRNAMTEGGTKPISGRYLIDGYPRAMDQVTGFESAICKPTFVLAFDAAESVLEERLVNRGKTSGRADDNVESIRKRFATFKAQSEPVITTYGAQGLVKSINSERPVDEVYQDVRPIFMDELRRMTGPAVPTPSGLSLVFVLGGPGSGKGTNCERISKEFGYKHLSSGDLLRDEVKSGSELGLKLNAIMQTGALVPGEIVLKILRNAMTEGGTTQISGRYLIDGYPRALDQVVAFEAAICKPSLVLAFDAAESVLEERLVNRGKTSGRADDNVESIRKRFATFKAQSEPVIQVYSKEGLVKSLNSERPVDEVYADVRPIFEAEIAAHSTE